MADRILRWRQAYAAPFSGWDFRDMAVRDDPLPWNFVEVAGRHMQGATSLLDIGTGGGERLAELAAAWPPRVVATEEWPPNVPVAAARLAPLGAIVVTARTSATGDQPFRAECFDLVLARHSAVKLSEIHRVLAPGGALVTQQVAPNNLDDLRERFGIDRPTPPDFVDMSSAAIETAGLSVIEDQLWDGRMHVRDVEALLSYIRAVPWELPDFDFDEHLPVLHELDEQPGPISFGISRSLLIARRP